MPNRILSHRPSPFIYTRKQGLGAEDRTNNLLQFIANDLHNLLLAALQDLLMARAAKKTADERAIGRGTVRKLVMSEGRRKHATAGTARHQESKTRRQR